MTDSRCVVVEPITQLVLSSEENIIKHDKCIYTIVREGRANKEQVDISEEVEAFLRKIGKEQIA